MSLVSLVRSGHSCQWCDNIIRRLWFLNAIPSICPSGLFDRPQFWSSCPNNDITDSGYGFIRRLYWKYIRLGIDDRHGILLSSSIGRRVVGSWLSIPTTISNLSRQWKHIHIHRLCRCNIKTEIETYKSGGNTGAMPVQEKNLFALQIGDFDHSDPFTLKDIRGMHERLRNPFLPQGNLLVNSILDQMSFWHKWDCESGRVVDSHTLFDFFYFVIRSTSETHARFQIMIIAETIQTRIVPAKEVPSMLSKNIIPDIQWQTLTLEFGTRTKPATPKYLCSISEHKELLTSSQIAPTNPCLMGIISQPMVDGQVDELAKEVEVRREFCDRKYLRPTLQH